MDNQTILNIIEIVTTSIIVPFAVWGLNSLKNWAQSKTENDLIEKYINYASNAVELVVKETTQTYVDNLKKQGKFDAAAQKEAFNITFERVKNLLTIEALEAVTIVYGDVNAWLASKIESEVKNNH